MAVCWIPLNRMEESGGDIENGVGWEQESRGSAADMEMEEADIEGRELGVQGALFMTIYDENGAKRLLSSAHPAYVAEGLSFVFPPDMQEYELCRNDSGWEKAQRRECVLPPESAGDMVCVQFRARGREGELRYSRRFVLMRKRDPST